MKYVSTRGASAPVSASQAILRGIAPDGGLYIPETLPQMDEAFLSALCGMDYAGRAAAVLARYLDDYTEGELLAVARAACARFEDPAAAAPTVRLDEDTWALELWHGPTCAFKDMALTVLPHLLTAAMRKQGVTDRIMILVATSGDTGKAALAGFADVPGTAVTVFYPCDGVSAVQQLQMVTQTGSNVAVFGVEGNFDDTQNGVKAIFADEAFARRLAARGVRLSSANSINWGRLAPQIVYYVSAYCDLLNARRVRMGEPMDVCVPTGNFGDILAAFYARRSGLPVGRLICASNANDVLTEFLTTGVYDRNRPFHKTASPSMDILISSNVERLLAELSGHDGPLVAGLMAELARTGRYVLPEPLAAGVRALFRAGCTDDAGTYDAIRRQAASGWLPDPHTGVALKVLSDLRESEKTARLTVVASTASPFKFAADVNAALDGAADRPTAPGGVEELSRLAARTGLAVPAPLDGLDRREKRFTARIAAGEMAAAAESAV